MRKEWFKGCSDKLIQQLMVQNPNPLAETKEEFLSGFQTLYLEGIKDGKLHSFFKSMDNLVLLSIDSSDIGNIVKSSSFPENIRTLVITNCGVADFIADGKGLSDIITLNLSVNNLTKIPDNLNKFEILYEIVLSSNWISGNLTLECDNGKEYSIDLSHNPIESITCPKGCLENYISLLLKNNYRDINQIKVYSGDDVYLR